MDEKTIARFWSKVDKRGPTPQHCSELGPCWLWTAAKFHFGHGAFKYRGKQVKAHRFVYELTFGPIPDAPGYHRGCVCHRCDNPACCNPSHLFAGSHSANVADKMAKGREAHCGATMPAKGDSHGSRVKPWALARGERNGSVLHPELLPRGMNHGRARLTDDQVRLLRERAAQGESQRSLATKFALGLTTVGHIVHRRTWAHL